MKQNFRYLTIMLTVIAVVILSFFPTGDAFAATCSGSGCNWIDPYGTTCWNDAYPARYSANGGLENRNMYSPGCNANWSKTNYASRTWLAAETVGVYTYHGNQPYSYVYNNMWDGSSVVCTRGHQGSSYMNYNLHTQSICA